MPNPHYQRVLEQDQTLPAPVRWLSRAMSSWWTIGVLALFVVGYVFFAHAPLGGKYLWQYRFIDTTQHAMLTWWPLLVAAWLLAAVLLWSAMRRLPWRIENLGAFIAILGLATVLISQTWAFRSQTTGIAAVPISESKGDAQADALALNYTTRYGDTHDRVLVVMIGGTAPITIPLDGLPRWNDAAGDNMPKLKLHDHPKLAAVLGFGNRITTAAYIADGELTETDDGTQTATPTDAGFRNMKSLPYPAKALLALEITTDTEDGGTQTTTAWLPFEPEGTDALVPKHFFPVDGLGSVGLAFRPASKKMPFALGADHKNPPQKQQLITLHIADTDSNGKLLQPVSYDYGVLVGTPTHRSFDDAGRGRDYTLDWVAGSWKDNHALIAVTAGTSNPFILAGMITFALGVFLDRAIDWLGSRPKQQADSSAA